MCCPMMALRTPFLWISGDARSLTDDQSRDEWSPHRGSAALPYTKTHTTLFVDAGFVQFRLLPGLHASSFVSRPSRARCFDHWTAAWQRPRPGSIATRSVLPVLQQPDAPSGHGLPDPRRGVLRGRASRKEESGKMSCSPEPVLASYMGAMRPSLNPASFLSNQWGSP